MGPAAGATQWDKALVKYASRAKATALMQAPPTVSVYNYNTKAVPVLGYEPQLTLIPDKVGQIERSLATHVMHFATNSSDDQTVFTLNAFGGPSVKSARALSLAALARTARKTLPMWEQKAQLLRESCGEHSALASSANGRCWGALWDSPPIAITLEAAGRHFQEAAMVSLGLTHKCFVVRHRAAIEGALLGCRARTHNRSEAPSGENVPRQAHQYAVR